MEKRAKPATGARAAPGDDNHNTQGPKQAQVVATILKSMGVEDYEPRVVVQLLEFMQRYVSDVLEDALVYSEHGGKSRVDVDDVRLAIQARVNFSFTGPPPREFMIDLAAKRNTASLPSIPQRMGVRMPPERYCLSSVNFQVDTVPETIIIENEIPPPRSLARATPRPGKAPVNIAVLSSALEKAAERDEHASNAGFTVAPMAVKRHATDDDDYDV